MLDPHTIAALARQLYDARKTRTPLRHFSQAAPGHDASTTATRSSAPG